MSPLAPSPHEMATIRRDATSLMRVEVQVYRPTYTPDGKGGQTTSYVLMTTGPGELAPMRADDEYYATRIGDAAGWIVTVATWRDVRSDDRIVVGDRTLEVIGTDRGRSGGWLQRVPCRELA